MRGASANADQALVASPSSPSVSTKDFDPSRIAMRLLTERAARERHLKGITDEMWLMLVDLWANHCRGRRVTVSDLCLSTYAPYTTALRHIGLLVNCHLAERVPDAKDGRRIFVHLTKDALERLNCFLAAILAAERT